MSDPSSPTSPRSPRPSSLSPPPRGKPRLENRKVVTRPSRSIPETRLIVGWAVDDEDDEDEDAENKKDRKRKEKQQDGFTEKDHFLPKSPQHIKSSAKETRHWTPSKTRHVIISPTMLNEQLDLDSPYNPSPFVHDPEIEKARQSRDTLIRKATQGPNGTVVTITKRKTRWTKFQQTVLNRGYVPLMLRLISLIFAIAALIIAGFITRYSVMGGVETRPSTVMAFVVNGVSVFYLPMVARDEYFGKAIGIRSPKHKLKLVMLDLFFIMLNSADLALAFNVLYDSEAGCLTDANTRDTSDTTTVCKLQQSLASVLFITLVGFVINFTVSIYRLVERIIATDH